MKKNGKIKLGVNMEFVRHEDKPFEWGVAKAAEIGYEYVGGHKTKPGAFSR